MKRIFSTLVILTLILSLTACNSTSTTAVSTATPTTTPTVSVTSEATDVISLNITINNVDENEILFDQTVEVSKDVETLADFLETQTAFNIETVSGDYGLMITSMCDVAQDMDNGPWWTYTSSNNEQCLTAGYCDGISSLAISDGDTFEFNLTSSFE